MAVFYQGNSGCGNDVGGVVLLRRSGMVDRLELFGSCDQSGQVDRDRISGLYSDVAAGWIEGEALGLSAVWINSNTLLLSQDLFRDEISD